MCVNTGICVDDAGGVTAPRKQNNKKSHKVVKVVRDRETTRQIDNHGGTWFVGAVTEDVSTAGSTFSSLDGMVVFPTPS